MNFDDFDIWWQQRGDATQLDAMESALRNIENQQENAHIEYSMSWRLARLHHFRAMHESDTTRAQERFVEGLIAAQRGLYINARGLEAHFWTGVCLAERARVQKMLASIHYLTQAQRHLHVSALFDPTFHFAGAWRVLGRIQHSAPWPIGSRKKALNFYHRALQIAPHNSTTHLYFAELLLQMKRNDEARKVLQEIVSQPLDSDWQWEQARDQKIAARLLTGF